MHDVHEFLRSLTIDLNLRGRTGASVLAIIRTGKPVLPTAGERLDTGDVLAVAGTHEAIDAATTMLRD